jgi:N-acetylmuramoyl-L-alanine amidase
MQGAVGWMVGSVFGSLMTGSATLALPLAAIAQAPAAQNAPAQSLAPAPLKVVYPRADHKTSAKQIFLIGSAPAAGTVLVNGQPIGRSASGHFAPSFPLQLGENTFKLQYQNQTLTLKVTREATQPPTVQGANFVKESLQPQLDIARLPGETLCLGAIAAPGAQVAATIAGQTIALSPQPTVVLPDNKAVLTGKAQAQESFTGQYAGCAALTQPGTAMVQYRTQVNGQTQQFAAPGKVTILNPQKLVNIEVTSEQGVARTGPSTDFSRLTPLPKGTRASVTGQEGEWLRLDYGAWIKQNETQPIAQPLPPKTIVRGVISRRSGDWSEVIFPLQTPVPIALQQQPQAVILSLYNATAQTDTIKLVDNPAIEFITWQQVNPGQIDYRLNLKTQQQWGYKLRYEGSSLILSLKNPPPKSTDAKLPLKGVKILVDPGHGSSEDPGSTGPTGLAEKDVTLPVSKKLRDRLVKLGATVELTRQGDEDILPNDRAKQIATSQPTIALSVHYNALPDDGDALGTQGVSTFWYQPQSESLARFLQQYVVRKLGRKSDGVLWNNLALTRPTVAPAVLIELGYMINPDEFDWIRDPQQQDKLADTLAQGLVEWFASRR